MSREETLLKLVESIQKMLRSNLWSNRQILEYINKILDELESSNNNDNSD